jgi:hypothetical protein
MGGLVSDKQVFTIRVPNWPHGPSFGVASPFETPPSNLRRFGDHVFMAILMIYRRGFVSLDVRAVSLRSDLDRSTVRERFAPQACDYGRETLRPKMWAGIIDSLFAPANIFL